MPIQLKVEYGEDPDYRGAGFYWPASKQKREELMGVKRASPNSYQSTYQCNPGERQGTIFLEEDFTFYKAPVGLSYGTIDDETNEFIKNGYQIVCAWDTGFEATSANDYTVCVVAMLVPCCEYHRGESELEFGPCEEHLDIYILNVFRSRVEWGELGLEFRRQHKIWEPFTHVIEKKGSGISLYQSMTQIGINVTGVNVTEGKRARAVEGTEAGSCQGWFRRHRVKFPENNSWGTRARAEWFPELLKEMKNFTGASGGRDDQVDAVVHLVNYAIQLGSQIAIMPTGWQPGSVDMLSRELPGFSPGGLTDYSNPDHKAQQLRNTWSAIEMLPNEAIDPFDGMCDRCAKYGKPRCPYFPMSLAGIDSCVEFEAKRPEIGGRVGRH
jgi:predicted phage terminase large subunit-like protein